MGSSPQACSSPPPRWWLWLVVRQKRLGSNVSSTAHTRVATPVENKDSEAPQSALMNDKADVSFNRIWCRPTQAPPSRALRALRPYLQDEEALGEVVAVQCVPKSRAP